MVGALQDSPRHSVAVIGELTSDGLGHVVAVAAFWVGWAVQPCDRSMRRVQIHCPLDHRDAFVDRADDLAEVAANTPLSS